MKKDEILILIDKDIDKKSNKYRGREAYFYRPENKKNDEYVKNGKVYKPKKKSKQAYINYFKMLVNQKVSYLLSKECTYDKTVPYDVWVLFSELIFNASLDCRSWIQFYIKNDKYKYKIINDSEIIPFYIDDELVKLIRYYFVNELLYVQIWTPENVEHRVYKKDQLQKSYIEPHYKQYIFENGEVKEIIPKSFNRIPFLHFDNNKDGLSDYDDISNLIEIYNDITCGYVINLDRFQDMIMILKGFMGDSEAVKKTIATLKETGGLSVPNDGDVNMLEVDIPVEAREALLSRLKDAIFEIGRGVDQNKTGDGNVTNVVLRSRYVQLDDKCNDVIKLCKKFYFEFLDFFETELRVNYKDVLEFNKNQIINETEAITNCIKSTNILSLKTVLKNHPFVKDVEEELKQIEEERVVNLENMKEEEETLNNNANNL